MTTSTREWELPSGSNSLLPTTVLQSEEGYRNWSTQTKGALEYATLWGVVGGTETLPAMDNDAIALWKRKDGAARTMILRALSPSIATTVDGLTTAHEYWEALETQFSRTSLTSAVTWFRSLISPLQSVHELESYIQAFQDATRHIKSAGFKIPDQISSGLFLSTLIDVDGEPTQWQAFTAKFSLTATTTLNETIADVRNER